MYYIVRGIYIYVGLPDWLPSATSEASSQSHTASDDSQTKNYNLITAVGKSRGYFSTSSPSEYEKRRGVVVDAFSCSSS